MLWPPGQKQPPSLLSSPSSSSSNFFQCAPLSPGPIGKLRAFPARLRLHSFAGCHHPDVPPSSAHQWRSRCSTSGRADSGVAILEHFCHRHGFAWSRAPCFADSEVSHPHLRHDHCIIRCRCLRGSAHGGGLFDAPWLNAGATGVHRSLTSPPVCWTFCLIRAQITPLYPKMTTSVSLLPDIMVTQIIIPLIACFPAHRLRNCHGPLLILVPQQIPETNLN